MRVLCLHGVGTNGRIFDSQTSQYMPRPIQLISHLEYADNLGQRPSDHCSPATGNGISSTAKNPQTLHRE
jgi:hypothetical protein